MTPNAAQHQRIDMMSMLILGVCVLWAGYWFVHAQDYWEDDAYIHLEYARNLFGGKGFMFNGLVSNGDTSPVWVLLLGLSHMVWPDWLGSGKALTVASTAFAASMVYLYAQRLARALGAEPGRVPATMVALFVFNPYFCYWAFSGMEAVLAAGLLLLIVMLLTPERPGRTSFFSAAILLGLAPLVRPEMILLLVVTSPFLLWQWVQLTRSMSARHKLVHFALAAVLLALPLLIWSIYALQAFGYVLPNTNAAKRASPDSSVVMRLLSVYGMGFPGVLISLLALPLAAWWQGKATQTPTASLMARCRGLFPALTWPLLIWAVATTAFYVVNHTYVQTRYAMVLAPALMLTLLWALMRGAPRALALAVGGVALSWGLISSLLLTHPFIQNKAEGDRNMSALATYINQNLAPDQRIAVYSIGQLGYETRNLLIDVGGITRPEASKYLWDAPEVMIRWAKGQGADYYIMGDQPEPGATLVHEIKTPQIGWSLKPSYYQQVSYLRLWKLHHD
jgi:hypothetical protein